jgi:hypothetical protein
LILSDVDMTRRCLPQRAHTKKRAIAFPSFLLDPKNRYAARARQSGLKMAGSLFTAKAMGGLKR